MPADRAVHYVDFGYTRAWEFWSEIAMPAYERFKATPNRQAAIEASLHLWHIHEWAWHEDNPGADTRQNLAYDKFKAGIISRCPELAWVRDIADAGKHRGLGRRTSVAGTSDRPNIITVNGEAVTFLGQPISVGNSLHLDLHDG